MFKINLRKYLFNEIFMFQIINKTKKELLKNFLRLKFFLATNFESNTVIIVLKKQKFYVRH